MNKIETIISYHSFHLGNKFVVMLSCIGLMVVTGIAIFPKEKSSSPVKAKIYSMIPKNCTIDNVSTTDANTTIYTVACKK